MNRDSRTQPLATERLPPGELMRRPTTVAETLPAGPEFGRQSGMTEPLMTVPLMTQPAMTEAFVEPAAYAMTVPLAPEAATRTEPCDAAVAVALSTEAEEIRPPTDSEPLRQLDRLSALVEQELRKSNPAYVGASGKSAPPAAPAPPASAEEESLQSYLDRFMERVTGKKPDAPPAAELAAPLAAPPVAAVPAAGEPAPGMQSREPARAPECRQKLAAMRDLANENARSAVAVHAGRYHWQRTRQTLFAAAAASVVSTGCALLHLANNMPGAIEGAVCAGMLAMLMTGRFFLRCRRMTARTVTA
jgi:hypothetical protein